jgi:excinuclease UvrABC ATPase subunit
VEAWAVTMIEAAEFIMKTQPFIDCINCEGTGFEYIGFNGQNLRPCSSCKGKKKQLLLEYEQACKVLGLAVP